MKSSERDWPEDFATENGNYECICHKCRNHFIGYKRRITCKLCVKRMESLTKAESLLVDIALAQQKLRAIRTKQNLLKDEGQIAMAELRKAEDAFDVWAREAKEEARTQKESPPEIAG